MKKTIALILALAMIMSLAACGSSNSSSAGSSPAIEPSVSDSPVSSETPESGNDEKAPAEDSWVMTEPVETPEVTPETEQPDESPEETPEPQQPDESPEETPEDSEQSQGNSGAYEPEQPAQTPDIDLTPGLSPVVTPLPSPDPNAPDIPTPTPVPPEITTDSTEPGSGISLGILSNVWKNYPKEERFALAGGDYSNMTMDAPGSANVADTLSLDALYGMPESAAALIDDAAGMMHMMNANTFTVGCYHLINSADMSTVAESLKDNIMNRQWMCGFPDTLIIVQVGTDSIVAAFGNAGLIENFKARLSAAYACSVLVEEALA